MNRKKRTVSQGARKLARIEMDWRTSKKLVTLRCTSDLEGEGTASALPRNGGRQFVAGLSTGLTNPDQPRECRDLIFAGQMLGF